MSIGWPEEGNHFTYASHWQDETLPIQLIKFTNKGPYKYSFGVHGNLHIKIEPQGLDTAVLIQGMTGNL